VVQIDTPAHERKLISCLSSLEVSSTACSYDSLVAAINADTGSVDCPTAADELIMLLGVDDDDAARTTIEEVCASAEDAEEANAMSFEDILSEGNQFQKEFFDGNKWPNDQRQTKDNHGVVKNVLEHEAYRILETYEGAAQKKIIAWPGSLPNFQYVDPATDEIQGCALTAAMCCWIQDRQVDGAGDCDAEHDENCVDADPEGNTDVCYVDMSRAQQSNHVAAGFAIFDGAGNEEGKAYCHGFAWSADENNASHRYKGNALFHVAMYENLYTNGYARNVPGAPMCGCMEQMPVVTEAACTKVNVALESVTFIFAVADQSVTAALVNTVTYTDCGDLKTHFDVLSDTDDTNIEDTLVGDGGCPAAVNAFLGTKGYQRS
jgi:hypothetical protein